MEASVGRLPDFHFTIRATTSVTADHSSLGRLMVNSRPLKYRTAWLMESRHGLSCGVRL
jgi:hypothetical protein